MAAILDFEVANTFSLKNGPKGNVYTKFGACITI